MVTRLEPETLLAMKGHAARSYPDECCGLVLASPEGALEVVPIRNVQDEMHRVDPVAYPRTARTAYVGDAGELREALEKAGGPGWRLVAFYHSHPDHEAYFSEEDVAQATPFGEPSYPEALQVVIPVQEGKPGAEAVFAWSEAESSYLQLD
jgi:proteasome lid subunit RPN8/RPN11